MSVSRDVQSVFQSTPSVGRATSRKTRAPPRSSISIHALRGEGDDIASTASPKPLAISIHALRGEGDSPRAI